MGARGYVVRGLYKGRHAGISDLQGSSAGPREPHPFTTLDYAAERAIELRRFDWTDVAIFRVRDDGTEERLPSYEEALGEHRDFIRDLRDNCPHENKQTEAAQYVHECVCEDCGAVLAL